MRLKDPATGSLRSGLTGDKFEFPLSLACEKASVTPHVPPQNGIVGYAVDYAFYAVDKNGQRAWNFTCLLMVQATYEGTPPSSAKIAEFAPKVLEHAHPHLVRFVQSAVKRAKLSSSSIDLGILNRPLK